MKAFFGVHVADRVNIDDRVVKLIGEMLASNDECSRLMDMVPRPAGVKPGLAYVIGQLANIARRVTSGDGDYMICRYEIARQYKTRLLEASMGL